MKAHSVIEGITDQKQEKMKKSDTKKSKSFFSQTEIFSIDGYL